MEILNTMEHVGQAWNILGGVVFLILAIFAGVATVYLITDRDWFALVMLVGTMFLALISFGAFSDPGPTHYEVRITDGYVIDAQKYKVVETRGEIVVIEELRR